MPVALAEPTAQYIPGSPSVQSAIVESEQEIDETSTPLQSVLRRGRTPSIDIVNAREHNLKGIDVSIPRESFTVITGVSGSGNPHWLLTYCSMKGNGDISSRSMPTP